MYDSVMVAFARNEAIPGDIRNRYNQLIKTEKFLDAVSSSTTDVDTVRQRINLATEVLFK